jgi:hypothetical protein
MLPKTNFPNTPLANQGCTTVVEGHPRPLLPLPSCGGGVPVTLALPEARQGLSGSMGGAGRAHPICLGPNQPRALLVGQRRFPYSCYIPFFPSPALAVEQGLLKARLG